MAKYFIEDTTLKSMADTIRSLMGSTAPLTPSEMTAGVQEAKEDVDSAMDALETLGVEVPEGSDIGDLAGLVSEVESGTDTSDATATASDILSGKTAYVDGEKVTGSIISQSAKTIIPTTADQTAVASGVYTDGDIIVKGDSNLKSENIVIGVSIFGVDGSAETGDITDSGNVCYISTDTPFDSFGNDGDIFIQKG